jgi:hypothetical protein
MEASKDNTFIEWKEVKKKQARGINGIDLGIVKEVGQTYVVTERTGANNEKFYIPKYLAGGYDDNVLRFTVTEEEARNTFMKDILSSAAENSVRKSGTFKEGKGEKGKSGVYSIIKKEQQLAKRPRDTTLRVSARQNYSIYEQEIIIKAKLAANELKEIILAITKMAENKIREVRDASTEKQARVDAEQISKMGDLATQFTKSFEDILSEIRTKKYEEQEQIYRGFLKLMEQHRKLLIARQNLSTKLNDSVPKPVIDTEDIEGAQKKTAVSENDNKNKNKNNAFCQE